MSENKTIIQAHDTLTDCYAVATFLAEHISATDDDCENQGQYVVARDLAEKIGNAIGNLETLMRPRVVGGNDA